MHAFPATLIGTAVWICAIIMARHPMPAILFGPFIVSSVVLVLTLAPAISRARPWSAGAFGAVVAALLVFIKSITAV
jgi:hypothetical protein